MKTPRQMNEEHIRARISNSLAHLTPEERALLEATRCSELVQTAEELTARAQLGTIQAQAALFRLMERGILAPSQRYAGATSYYFPETSQAQYAAAALSEGEDSAWLVEWLALFGEDEQGAGNDKEAGA